MQPARLAGGGRRRAGRGDRRGAMWKPTAIDSSEWAVIAAAAPAEDGGVLVGGSFGGTLRIGAKVVSSDGQRSDGFVARLTAAGEVRSSRGWAGPAPTRSRASPGRSRPARDRRHVAPPAWTSRGAARGAPSTASPYADGFVLRRARSRRRRSHRGTAVFGRRLGDAVAGVAIGEQRGRASRWPPRRATWSISRAGPAREGPADLLVVVGPGRRRGPGRSILGGDGFDGAAAISRRRRARRRRAGSSSRARCTDGRAPGDRGRRRRTPSSSLLDGGAVVDAWHAGGAGREEIAALAAVPGGLRGRHRAHRGRAPRRRAAPPASRGASTAPRSSSGRCAELREPPAGYQMRTRSAGASERGPAPAFTPNAAYHASRLRTVEARGTRAAAWPSVWMRLRRRRLAGLAAPACAKARKNCWSPVKPCHHRGLLAAQRDAGRRRRPTARPARSAMFSPSVSLPLTREARERRGRRRTA